MSGRLDADEGGPVRCAVIAEGPFADVFAAVTGLSVLEASLLVDDHIGRGEQ